MRSKLEACGPLCTPLARSATALAATVLVVLMAAAIGCSGEPEPRSQRPERSVSSAQTREDHALSAEVVMERFVAEIARRAPDVELRRVEGMRVELVRGTEVVSEMTLENAWGECRPAPEHCQRVIERYADVFLRAEPAPLRIENVRLVLFGRDVMRRQNYAALAWADPFAGDFMSAFVLDSADSIETLSQGELDEVGMPRAALRVRALANMRRAFGPLRHEAFTPDGSVHMITTSGNGLESDSYNAARVLLPELWRPLREAVRGELVAAAPARDVAMFTGTEEPRGLESLAYLAREMYHREPHPVSPQLVRWSENGWVPIAP